MADQLTIIGSGQGTDTSSLGSINVQPNTVYEHTVNVYAFAGLVDFFNSGQIEGQLQQNNCELLNKEIIGNSIVYRFQLSAAASTQAAENPMFVLPLLGLVIGAVMILVAALIISWTLSQVIVPAAFSVLKIVLIGAAAVLVIAGAYIVLKKSGASKPLGAAAKKAGQYFDRAGREIEPVVSGVRRRIVEEF